MKAFCWLGETLDTENTFYGDWQVMDKVGARQCGWKGQTITDSD